MDIAHLKAARGAFAVLTSIAMVTPLPLLRRVRPYQLQGLLIRYWDTPATRGGEHPPADLFGISHWEVTRVTSQQVALGGADLDLAQSWIAECCTIHDCEDMARNDSNSVQDAVKRLFC